MTTPYIEEKPEDGEPYKTDEYECQLRDCVRYCKEVNGLPMCKNCGLTDHMIDGLVAEVDRRARESTVNEVLAILKEPTKVEHDWYIAEVESLTNLTPKE